MWRKMSRERSKYVLIGKELCLPKNARKKRKTEKTKIFFKKGLTNAFCFGIITKSRDAGMAQSVEHVIGNDEVISSILITSSIPLIQTGEGFCYIIKSYARENIAFCFYFSKLVFFKCPFIFFILRCSILSPMI